jgi:hypothetical protein
MSNNNETKTACIVLIFVIIIILIISLLYRKNTNTTEYEQFLNYQDAKTKTLNWCSKMKNVGLLTNDQFNKCVSTYTDTTLGILPSEVSQSSSSRLETDYALYNSRLKSITPNILDTNTNSIMLVNSEGSFMGCNSNNSVYFTDDNSKNSSELTFTLTPLSNNNYTLTSKYGKYLINNDTELSTNNSDIPVIIAGGGGGSGGSSGGVAGGLGGSAGSNTNGDGSSGTGNTGVVGGLGGPFATSSSKNSTSGFALAGSNATNTGGGGGGSNGGMMGNANGSGGGAGGSYVNPKYLGNNKTATYTTNDANGIPSVIIDWSVQPSGTIISSSTIKTSALFTGQQQTWTVPLKSQIPITQALFTVIGGKGSGVSGGFGAKISTTLKVIPGDTYNIFVGTYASGTTGGVNQSGYNGGNGAGTGGGGGAATTVFLGATPVKTNKAAKTIFCASFTGTVLGPMASWAITKYDSGNTNFSNLTFESVKVSNYFLSSTVNNVDSTLVLNNGNDATNMWQAIPVSNNAQGSSSSVSDTQRTNYITIKTSMLNRIINIKAQIIYLENFKFTLNMLKNMVTTSYQKISNYVDTSISITTNSGSAGNANQASTNLNGSPNGSPSSTQSLSADQNVIIVDGEPQNILPAFNDVPSTTMEPTTTSGTATSIDVLTSQRNVQSAIAASRAISTNNNMRMSNGDKTTVLTNINTVKTSYINRIDSDISDISSLLNTLKDEEIEIENEYSIYLQSLVSDLSSINDDISTNSETISNSQSQINNLNEDNAYYESKQKEIKNLDKTSNLNIDLITSYTNSNATLVKGYPVIIFIVLLILLYLIYVTFNTFMQNIYYAY